MFKRNGRHQRDVRRLVVAMSRARLGLYIFARASLFQNCFELTPAFRQLTARPLRLHIVPGESFPAQRRNGDVPPYPAQVIKNMPEMAAYVYNMYMHMMQSSQQYQYHQGLLPPPASSREPDFAPSQDEEMEVEESTSQKNEAKSKSPDLESNTATDPTQGEEKEKMALSGKEEKQETASTEQSASEEKSDLSPQSEPPEDPARISEDPARISEDPARISEDPARISGTEQEVSEPGPQMEVDSSEAKETAENTGDGNNEPAEDGTEHQKMPDHPGRDSDSEYSEDEGTGD